MGVECSKILFPSYLQIWLRGDVLQEKRDLTEAQDGGVIVTSDDLKPDTVEELPILNPETDLTPDEKSNFEEAAAAIPDSVFDDIFNATSDNDMSLGLTP